MNTAILRIAAPAAGAQDYDITLMLRDEAGQEQPLAATTCPVTLQPPGMAGALPEAALVDRFAAAQGQDEVIRTIGVQLHALIAGVGAALAALPAATSVLLDIEPPALRRLPCLVAQDERDVIVLGAGCGRCDAQDGRVHWRDSCLVCKTGL